MLSFCLSHTCCCIYETGFALGKVCDSDKEILILATLRALEFSRFRTMTEKHNLVTSEEHKALYTLDERLNEQYRRCANKLLGPGRLVMRERMYIKLLCKCNRAGVCFFNSSLPLGLVYFLVKITFQTSTLENEELMRCLCLYTLCHSYSPICGEHGRLLTFFRFKFKHACIFFISITQTAHRT